MNAWFSLPALALGAWIGCAPAALAADPKAQIRGEMDADLRDKLVRAVGESSAPPANRFEARRRAREAVGSAEALLRSEGYYQPVLEDVVEGETQPQAIVQVTPGRRFLLTSPAVDWLAPEPSREAMAASVSEIGLTPGEPGRAVDVIAAEGRIIASLTRQGYADARTEPRRVVVDHAAFTVAPTYRVAAGPLVRLDGVLLDTRGPTNAEWVAGLAPWSEGDRYEPEDVAELERRLLETGVYDGVGVALAPAERATADGLRPIIVTLTDRPRRITEAGATFSTAQGSGVDVIQTRYNRLGRADTLRLELRLADIDSRLGADLSLPHWGRPGRTLRLSTAAVNEDTDAYRRIALVLAADLRQRIGKTSWFSYGLGLDAGHYTQTRFDPLTQAPVVFDRNLAVLTGRTSAYWDQSDDPLDPRSGWRLSASAQPTAVTGDDNALFLKAETQGTVYYPFGEGGRTVLAGRLRLGSIIGAGELSVPSDRLFYSGGGGSVRGYEYQGVAPRLPDNTPRGGTSLFETSFEVRRDVGRNFQAVAFVDAGSVGFSETPDFSNLRYGAGFGVRYKLPFGPIRADVAFPLDRRPGDADFQVYISIGQAF
ncbi:autotransporter assembly complex protein TamA [Brevundimonas sp.]|uniref:autotransporter assembly complex protein TamA n=1 Tax=Brevundimonas sp. TaxID=1871086 RepID=UPI0025BCAF3F|nr:autotransporter assembly complex family protein [Brevundimonas sp.]